MGTHGLGGTVALCMGGQWRGDNPEADGILVQGWVLGSERWRGREEVGVDAGQAQGEEPGMVAFLQES